MHAPLTERQNQVYEFIRTYVRDHRKPPTIKEIGEGLIIASTNGVHKQLVALEKKGYIARTPRESRGLRLLDEDDPFAFGETTTPSLPLISRTHSSEPGDLRRRPQSHFDLDHKLLGRADPDGCVLVLAGDDGMSGAGVYKGDLLVVEETKWGAIRNATLVAALIGDRVLARRFDYTNQRFHLRPNNRSYTDETYPAASPECHIIGPVVSVIRRIKPGA